MTKRQAAKRLMAGGLVAASLVLGGAASARSVPVPTAATKIVDHAVVGHLNVEATAYGPSAQDNFPYGASDAFGQPLRPGMIAVDPSVIPLGSTVWVSGYHSSLLPAGGFVAHALDTGGAISGHHIDIYIVAGPQAVAAFGVQHAPVTLLTR